MKKHRATALLAGILIVGLVLFTARQLWRLSAIQAELATLNRQRADSRRRLQELQRELASLRQRVTDSQRLAASLKAREKTSKEQPTLESPELARRLEHHFLIASHPLLRAAWFQVTRTAAEFDYGRLFQRLKLSPEQIERFKGILISGQQAQLDLATAAQSQDLSWGDREMQGLQEAAFDQYIDQPMKNLLGSDYPAYREYYENLASWSTVRDLGSFSAYSDQPLTDEQANALEQVLTANSPRSRHNIVVPNRVRWDQALPSVQAILTPEQQQLLEEMRQTTTVSTQLETSLRGILRN